MLPFVSRYLPNVHFRVKKCYALVLATGNLVRRNNIKGVLRYVIINTLLNQLCQIPLRQITYCEILDFFVHQWAPVVNQLHESQGGLVGKFLSAVIEAIKDIPIHEVRLAIALL